MKLTGKQLINGNFTAAGDVTFPSMNATLNLPTDNFFYEATTNEIKAACIAASVDFETYKSLDRKTRSHFLKSIASEIESLGDFLLETASIETGLGIERLKGERQRTINQLLSFAKLLEDEKWVRPIIDEADHERKPLPKPDLRQMQIPLGPVVVFGASNFPLAFSVAGGDTSSALAAGCPVIFKAHPAHPGTCELVATSILNAMKKNGIPLGTFAMLHGKSNEVGGGLVVHEKIKAVAFTGSYRGGKALYDLAVRREKPIPVYAEMGSVNPVIILPSAIATRSEVIAKQLSSSIVLGSGQFCTNPGLIVVLKSNETDLFLQKVADELAIVQPMTMLTQSICQSYLLGVKNLRNAEGVTTLSTYAEDAITPHLLKVSAQHASKNPSLVEEVFGPSSVAVICEDLEDLRMFCNTLQGQLTATIIGEDDELRGLNNLVEILMEKAGRLLVNGYPTGVEVSPAMIHGGPFPATTDARSTSVGLSAIYRFTRPVCFQNFPKFLLPKALQN